MSSYHLEYSGVSDLDTACFTTKHDLHFPAADSVVRLGRAADNTIKLYATRLPEAVRTCISRYHAAVDLDSDGVTVYLRDLGGSNGTYLGGTRLHPQQRVEWPVGEEAVFGGNSGIVAGESVASYRANGKVLMRVFAFRLRRGRGDAAAAAAATSTASGAAGLSVMTRASSAPAAPRPHAPAPAGEPATAASLKRPRQDGGEEGGGGGGGSDDTEHSAGEEGGGGGGGRARSALATGISRSKSTGSGGAAAAALASSPAPRLSLPAREAPPTPAAVAAASAVAAAAQAAVAAAFAPLACRVCRAAPVEPVAAACGHIFCGACFGRAALAAAQGPPPAGVGCPHCRAPLASKHAAAALLAEGLRGGEEGARALAALCTPLPGLAEALAAATGGVGEAAAAPGAAAAPPPPHKAPALLLARALLAQASDAE